MTEHGISQVHFVGSLCLSNTRSAIRYLATSFRPDELRSIPDGEPGKRQNFVLFQTEVFAEMPYVLLPKPGASGQTLATILPDHDAPPIKLKSLSYAEAALESYSEFCKLREEGVVPTGTRFQVSLPTPINVIGNLIHPDWRSTLEPVYTEALFQALLQIQSRIPHEDLAVQWDMASEFAFLEGAVSAPPWFPGSVQDGLLARATRMIEATDARIPVGVHLCYGDLGHEHFIEPNDLAHVVEFANALVRSTRRPINWAHMPVPKARSDPEYFAPLRQLQAPGLAVFLGLLHLKDHEGTSKKIATAKKFISNFGIATECGLGRSSKEELESAVQIAQQVLRSGTLQGS